ncbi:uncharacterized protein FOMMEDRAFT_79278 [Fomitiporia mediterranea MF3/22]|uniref:uncharacterized protein n=1 Tax=Fomitiporia mediterranea (strain MF3/22) TaxID=694068 RepID=UPI0004408E33|nr:uncharacterized protein FOMMEDRAFT_79278 [Fomitiporia mediterranea MF3/22]EJD06050.1 hypothetical protein FOMMEDRAFT_79278 [Fomitiporia mediterranea MF3/22]
MSRTPRSSLAGGLQQISPSKLVAQSIPPTEGPSRSASQPFDWEAVRLRKPPPYGGPLDGARARAARKSEAGLKNAQKRVVKRPGLFKRISSLPSRIVDEISMFPHNVPLPDPKPSAWIIGGSLHVINLLVRVSQSRQVAEEELPWADLYNEHRGTSWFDWTTPVTFLLIAASFYNAFRLLSQNRVYFLHHRTTLVNSPRAAFVDAQIDLTPPETPSLLYRVFSWLWYQFSVSWRFLLNFKPPAPRVAEGARVERVQQLSVWEPGELEMSLFAVYSPAHAFLWVATTGSNWIVMFTIMGIIGLQIHLLCSSYAGLMKDKQILSAEVMNEYNEKFVNPRVNPVRFDKAVMTHQAEVIDYWNDYESDRY